jgi:hypothetical protein
MIVDDHVVIVDDDDCWCCWCILMMCHCILTWWYIDTDDGIVVHYIDWSFIDDTWCDYCCWWCDGVMLLLLLLLMMVLLLLMFCCVCSIWPLYIVVVVVFVDSCITICCIDLLFTITGMMRLVLFLLKLLFTHCDCWFDVEVMLFGKIRCYIVLVHYSDAFVIVDAFVILCYSAVWAWLWLLFVIIVLLYCCCYCMILIGIVMTIVVGVIYVIIWCKYYCCCYCDVINSLLIVLWCLRTVGNCHFVIHCYDRGSITMM